MSKFCSNCGTQLDEQAGFCSNCGTPVAPEQPQQAQQPQQAAWLTPDPAPQAPQAPQGPYAVHENAGQQPIYARPDDPNLPEGKGHLKLGIAVTIGVVLLIAGIIVLLVVVNPFKWFGSSSSAKSYTPQEILNETAKIYLSDDPDIDAILPNTFEYQFLLDTDKREEMKESLVETTKREIAAFKDEYGKLTSLTATITSSEYASDSDKAKGIEYYKSKYHTEGIEEFLRVETELNIVGDKKSDTIEGSSYFVKVDGKWYALMNM